MMNFGAKSVSEPEKRYKLVWESLFAGKKAKAEAAYESAYKHLQTGIDLLGFDGWQRQHTRELVALNKMNALLRTCQTEEETYRVIAEMCQELFPESAGCLCMMDEAEIMLQDGAFWGNPPLRAAVLGVNESWVFYRGNLKQHETADIDLLDANLGYAPDDGYLCVPVNASGQVIASLSVCCGARPIEQSNEEWLHIMESRRMALTRIADHYALTLENLRLREALRMESFHDPLTGLYNQRYMEESLKREVCRAARHGHPVGLIMLEIDHFTDFTDTFGRQAAEVVLRELSTLLLRHTRGEDIVCRYGEGEFFLILPDISLDIAKVRAEELRVMVKELRFPHSDNILHITISIGLTALPGHSLDIHAGITAAERALDQAKVNGRDQVAVSLF